jgi:hypothetical protein
MTTDVVKEAIFIRSLDLYPNSFMLLRQAGAVVPSNSGDDWVVSGGAGIVPSRLDGMEDIRSGNPSEVIVDFKRLEDY